MSHNNVEESDPWLYAPSDGHSTAPTMEEWNKRVSSDREGLKKELWKHSGASLCLDITLWVSSIVSREHRSKIVEPFTGTTGSPSMYMLSALHSDSGAEGTRSRQE